MVFAFYHDIILLTLSHQFHPDPLKARCWARPWLKIYNIKLARSPCKGPKTGGRPEKCDAQSSLGRASFTNMHWSNHKLQTQALIQQISMIWKLYNEHPRTKEYILFYYKPRQVLFNYTGQKIKIINSMVFASFWQARGRALPDSWAPMIQDMMSSKWNLSETFILR